MTNTTDIKVLRDQPDHGPYALVMAQNEALTKGIVVLQRQLEAERQRADRYHFVAMSALEAQAEISEQLGISEDECDGSPEQIHEKIEMLQTEIAALKGDQVPVGWRFEDCENEPCTNGAVVSVGTGSDNIHLCAECSRNDKYKRQRTVALSQRLSLKVAAPQKTVEVADSIAMQNVKDIAHCLADIRRFVEAKFMTVGDLPSPEALLLSGPEWKHESDAIIAALNRVAAFYEQPQKPVVSKQKLCNWLEEEFGVTENQYDSYAASFSESVVLPAGFYADNDDALPIGRDDAIAAIKAAGVIVKDGE